MGTLSMQQKLAIFTMASPYHAKATPAASVKQKHHFPYLLPYHFSSFRRHQSDQTSGIWADITMPF